LESSEKKDGNQKGSNGKNGKEKELFVRNGVLTRRVEGLYIGKEQGMYKEEGKQ